MRIDDTDGSIGFPSGRLTRFLTRASFLSTALAKDAVVTVDNEPWITYDLRPENVVLASVVFEHDRLREVRLMLVTPADLGGEWSEADELARKSRHDTWLREQLGVGDYRFSWGSVESIYDQRAICSQIVVRYT